MPLPLLAIVAVKVVIKAVKVTKVAKVATTAVKASKVAKTAVGTAKAAKTAVSATKFGKVAGVLIKKGKLKTAAKHAAYKKSSLFGKAMKSGISSVKSDAVMQVPAMLRGEGYDVRRGFRSFVRGFSMPIAGKALQKIFRKGPSILKEVLCKMFGDPVDAISGNLFSNVTDFELPGPIPLIWKRSWYSSSSLIGHLGHGSRSSFEMGMDVFEEDQAIRVYLADGRVAAFPLLQPYEEFFNYQESLLLQREEEYYRLYNPETRYSYLFYPTESGYMHHKLGMIRDAQGHSITVEYDRKGYMSKITDSVGRELDVTTNEAGRITKIAFGSHVLLQYQYNTNQDLTHAVDAAGQATQMEYRSHLMVKKTDRNQNSFYWQYDGPTTGARVTKTWGDEGVLTVHLEYNDDAGYNLVTDSLGNAAEHHYDERNLCTKIVYADGSEKNMEYNEGFQLLSETDEEGRTTSYAYNRWSQVTGITRSDGCVTAFAYDDSGRLISTTDPEGASKSWVYNDDGTLHSIIDENGAETTYAYNENKLVESVTNAKGDAVRLAYDADGNLNQITLPDGASSRWEYDNRGNCLNEVNPLGAVQKFQYDALNRMVRAAMPDGNEISFQYNAYNDVVNAKDKQTEVSFGYTILGSLRSRVQSGRAVKFDYDTEERLISVTNEKGEIYKFDRDLKGNIVKETGFDGITRTFDRDLSGMVQGINRPGERWTRYQHDPLGNIVRADYYDGTWDTFAYNKNSALTEAANQHAELKLERDPTGRVIKELQGGHWIESEYDEIGNRTQLISSLGAKIATTRDALGQTTNVAASQSDQSAWAAHMQYNELGQEIERMLPGELISSWQYDATGKPTHHLVRDGQRDTLRRKYDWDINDQLKRVTNELTSSHTSYGYDEFSNLVRSDNGGRFGFIYRSVDDVGNIYEKEDKTDRIYGTGSRLEQSGVNTKELRNRDQGGFGKLLTKGTEFTYDGEGNLVSKTKVNGGVWQYEYFGNGMLAKVVLPDKTEVTFKYDPLGRRIEKQTLEATKKFVWDGNNPLHESDNEEIVTWVLYDGFVPTAKLTGKGNYSIISDYLGTPVKVYAKAGEQVWSAELDIYGRVTEHTGDAGFVPFRYQGQYHDVEAGLYYNRFRYYDPEIGQYISQDPIRLASGILNFYHYVANPNISIDPLGLDWNYVLVNLLGEVYYHGRASDNATLQAVATRHANNVGRDGLARFGPGDILRQTTPVGTRPDIVRGIEGIGTGQDGILGRGSTSVRGNIIEGVNPNRAGAGDLLEAGANMLDGRKPSQMPAQNELSFDNNDRDRSRTRENC